MSSEIVVSLAELEAHGVEADGWVAIKDQVYDVTSFIHQHPGGSALVEKVLGRDGTKEFSEEHEHSDSAWDMLAGMRVGPLEGGSHPARLPTESEATRVAAQLIDWKKPLVFQVGSLGKHYQQWVHTPIHTDKPLVLLGGWMEAFTNVQWWLPLVFWIPAIIAMLAYVFHFSGYSWVKGVPLYLGSVCMWPALEYFLHRFVYHMGSESYWANTAHFLFHGIHHLTPMDKTRLVAPPPLAIFIASPILLIVHTVSPSAPFKWALMAGLFSGYLVYDEIHYATHHANPQFAWLRRLKRHHMEHHYQVPDENFGVSNIAIDKLVGTYWARENV